MRAVCSSGEQVAAFFDDWLLPMEPLPVAAMLGWRQGRGSSLQDLRAALSIRRACRLGWMIKGAW